MACCIFLMLRIHAARSAPFEYTLAPMNKVGMRTLEEAARVVRPLFLIEIGELEAMMMPSFW